VPKPKPDDRSDNVEKLQEMIENTEENYNETKEYLRAHGEESAKTEKEQLENKNDRRLQAIEGFREEIKDEVEDQNLK